MMQETSWQEGSDLYDEQMCVSSEHLNVFDTDVGLFDQMPNWCHLLDSFVEFQYSFQDKTNLTKGEVQFHIWPSSESLTMWSSIEIHLLLILLLLLFIYIICTVDIFFINMLYVYLNMLLFYSSYYTSP